MSKGTITLAGVLTLFVTGSCLANDGTATFDYLKKDLAVLTTADPNLKELKMPTVPAPPKFTRQTRPRDRIHAQKQYRTTEITFFTDLLEWSHRIESTWTGLQDKLGNLDGKDVDPITVSFVVKQEALVDDEIEAQLKVQSWAAQSKEDLQKPRAPDYAIPEFIAGLVQLAYGSPTGFKDLGAGMVAEANQDRNKTAEKTALAEKEDLLRTALEKLKKDGVEVRAAKNEIVTQFSVGYPSFEWRELFESKGANEVEAKH